MRPQEAIAMLDRQLRMHGSTIMLIRKQPNGPDITHAVKGFLRDLKPSEITDGIGQGARNLAFSPTDLAGSAFEAEPPRRGDTAVVSGRRLAVIATETVLLANVSVRFNSTVAG